MMIRTPGKPGVFLDSNAIAAADIRHPAKADVRSAPDASVPGTRHKVFTLVCGFAGMTATHRLRMRQGTTGQAIMQRR